MPQCSGSVKECLQQSACGLIIIFYFGAVSKHSIEPVNIFCNTSPVPHLLDSKLCAFKIIQNSGTVEECTHSKGSDTIYYLTIGCAEAWVILNTP